MATDKVRRSLQSLGCILWEPSMSVFQNLSLRGWDISLVGSRWRVRASPNTGIWILWRTWMAVQSLLTIQDPQISPTNNHTTIYKNSLKTLLLSASSGTGDDRAYRDLIKDFIDWFQRNHLQFNARKTKKLVVDFRRHRQLHGEGTLRRRHLTSTWEFIWTINWTGLITLQQHTRKVRVDCIC